MPVFTRKLGDTPLPSDVAICGPKWADLGLKCSAHYTGRMGHAPGFVTNRTQLRDTLTFGHCSCEQWGTSNIGEMAVRPQRLP